MQYHVWRVVSALLRRTPPRIGYFIAGLIGAAAFYGWPRGRRATVRNFAHVLEGAPRSRVRRVARASLMNYCRYLLDFIRFPTLSGEAIVAACDGEDSFRALDGALERGKGAVIVCMHFGNWDLGAGAAAARGYPLSVVAETFPDPRLDELVVGARRRLGMTVIPMERIPPSLVRSLRQNGLLALLIDRPVPGDGVEVSFFGRPAELPAGPARLALRTGAAVVPVAFVRNRENAIDVTAVADFSIAPPATGDEERDIQSLTQAIVHAHEHFIRAHPEQWYMFREMWPRAQPSPLVEAQ